MKSEHTKRNFEKTARDFLKALPKGRGLQRAKVEDVYDALETIAAGLSEASANQYLLRVKSLLSFAQRAGYTRFNVGVLIKADATTADRGASLAKRIIREADVSCCSVPRPPRAIG